MTHDPLCEWDGNPHSHCDCDLIAKVRKDERYRAIENAVNVVLRMPSGAVMEIACAACNWDYGYESDLADLFGAYDDHRDNCPNTYEDM
jgi:hypothetical protein